MPEAKAKIRQRHHAGIAEFQRWLGRQKTPPTRKTKTEMFDFFIDQAQKKAR